jgi:hypothetical protein
MKKNIARPRRVIRIGLKEKYIERLREEVAHEVRIESRLSRSGFV